MRKLVLLLAFLVPITAMAQGKHCGPIDEFDKGHHDLFVSTVDGSGYKPASETLEKPYVSTVYYFLYVVFPRRSPEGSAGAAFSVKTYRFNNQVTKSDILLYRNQFPGRNPLNQAQIDRDTYDAFHDRGVSFRNPLGRFHAGYRTLEGSVETNREPRRKEFSLRHELKQEYEWPHPPLIRSMNLYVSAINPSGTCIPFNVHIDDDVQHIAIEINSLDASYIGQDYSVIRKMSIK